MRKGFAMDRRGAARVLVACGFVLLTMPQASAAEVHKRALLVGISDYAQHRPLQHFPSLHGAQDAARLAAVLSAPRYGFEVTTLTDGQATRQGILDAFQRFLVARAQPGDICLFYFSGHGQLLRAADVRLSGYDSSLVPFDYVGCSASENAHSNVRGADISAQVQALAAKVHAGGRRGGIVLIFDACHSGTAARGELIARGRDWDESLDGPKPPAAPDRPAPSRDSSGLLPNGEARRVGYVSIGACRDDQTAYEKDGCGLLSGALLASLEHAQPTTTWRELLETVTLQIQTLEADQMPVLEGDADQCLFNGQFRPRPRYFVLSLDADRGALILPLGRLHGMTVGSKFRLYRPGADVEEAGAAVAEATVADVADVHSTLDLADAWRGKVKPSALDGGRAVEIVHQPGDGALRVWLHDVTLDPAVLADFPVIKTAGIGSDHCDVELRAEQGMLRLLLAGGGAPRTVGALPLSTTDRDRLREALLGLWRVRYLLGLAADQSRQGTAPAEMRVVPLNTPRAADGTPTGVVKEPLELPREGGQMTLAMGAGFRLEFRNVSAKQHIHPTVLLVGPNGDLDVLYPLPGDKPDALDTGPDWRAVRDPRYGTLSWLLGVKHDGPPYRWDAATLGTNHFILLTTREPADFSWLVSSLDELLRQGVGREEESPLARLLRYARTGTRGAPAGLPAAAEDWSIGATACLVTAWR
jgi:hypothetical protein